MGVDSDWTGSGVLGRVAFDGLRYRSEERRSKVTHTLASQLTRCWRRQINASQIHVLKTDIIKVFHS